MASFRPAPKYTGVIREIHSRKIVGKIALWQTNSENPRSPVFYGTIQTDHGKAYVALWSFVKRKTT